MSWRDKICLGMRVDSLPIDACLWSAEASEKPVFTAKWRKFGLSPQNAKSLQDRSTVLETRPAAARVNAYLQRFGAVLNRGNYSSESI